MSEFFTYCETATTNCDSTVYNANYFDGWSIGAYVLVTSYSNALQTGVEVGICFEDSFACLGFGLTSTASTGALDNAWNGIFDAAYDFTTSAPTAANAV
jgi:hypothetical protein